MNRKVQKIRLAKPLVYAMGLIGLPLLMVGQTQARENRSVGRQAVTIVSIAGTNVKNVAAHKAKLRALMGHKRGAAKVLATCSCSSVAATPSAPSFWGCLKYCMADVGVSPVSMIGCGVACFGAATGVGAIVCAVCVGVSVTVIQVCSLGCAMGLEGGPPIQEEVVRKGKKRSSPPVVAAEGCDFELQAARLK